LINFKQFFSQSELKYWLLSFINWSKIKKVTYIKQLKVHIWVVQLMVWPQWHIKCKMQNKHYTSSTNLDDGNQAHNDHASGDRKSKLVYEF